MRDPLLVLVILTAVIIAVTAVSITIRNRREYRERLRRTREDFGKDRTRPIPAEQFRSYEQMIAASGHKDALDEITWNDLEMDRLYEKASHSFTACGDEILYEWLRTPCTDESSDRMRRARIDHFSADEEAAKETLASLAKSRIRYPLSFRLSFHERHFEAKENLFPYVLLCILLIASVVGLFFIPVVALLVLIGVLFVNIGFHLKGREANDEEKKILSPILSLTDLSKELLNKPLPTSDKEAIENDIRKLQPLITGTRMLSKSNSVSGGGGDLLLQYLNLFFHLDRFAMGRVREILNNEKETILDLWERVGAVDAAIAILSFRRTFPMTVTPEFRKGDAVMEAVNAVHPLLDKAVPNSFSMTGGNLITGSNASGKSTFLKTMTVNAVLAQSFGFACASSYRASRFRILTSMALRDDMAKKESYFVTEIRSIARMMEAAKKESPLLCVIDEVLRGTNTIDRIAASGRILKSFVRPNVLIVAATHDLELTSILSRNYRNWHFSEEVEEGDVRFSYLLKEGKASTRNALALLRAFDYPAELVDGAEEDAKTFEKEQQWQSL